ncbi:M20 family metallo-hydrolase [Gordonia sp. (in: high G+C Gram-positive bacteria)]|uniref:M20 family metallo-hydrolase n=1 Tax=Gordonia sp. (in: high G+C Gram-positive bacteria) TaxID=84139 RepID=UPI002623CAE9|nr:M20 family metallo-hydrolase [Gordonia sp. (in: high G+C Gram-positive bacteria)]HMS74689.1 M20 family metallo-hydrolase [Gordonia sp. (in: high G+C Gram-positive bacteria)]
MTGATDTAVLRIDSERLWESLSELGAVGAYHDSDTDLDGVRRLALTDDDIAGRELVLGWMRDAGLTIRMDAIGNVYARRAGLDDSLAPVLVGSHIDSVATAGRFDGCLGVLGGLEVVRTLNDHGVGTRRPFEVAIFTEEEGARFGTDMLGSATAAGRIPLQQARSRTDRDGVSVGEELDRHGLVGDQPVPMPAQPHAYLECHIEQGPILAEHNTEIGVVRGVQAITWLELEISGRAAHAGATPNSLRRDAELAAALIRVRLDEMVTSGDYGVMLATVGRHETTPNLINIVPSHVLMTVDLRNHDGDEMDRATDDLHEYLRAVEERTGTTISVSVTARTPPVHFPPQMQDRVAKAAVDLGLSSEEITSGAGHDAGEIAALCPAGMVFVPGLYDGISHNPREYSTPEACADGINVLLHAVLDLLED